MLPSAGGTTAPPGGTSPANPKPFSRSRFDGEIGCRVAACCCWIVCLKSSTVAGFGGCTRAAGGTEAVGLACFVPPVSHIMRTITTATPRITSCCVFFGSSPAGFGALFSTVPRDCALLSVWAVCSFLSGMGLSGIGLPLPSVPLNIQFFLSKGQITLVHNLWNDVDAVGQLEVD